MNGAKPFLTKFSKNPPKSVTMSPPQRCDGSGVNTLPWSTTLTEVRNETADDN